MGYTIQSLADIGISAYFTSKANTIRYKGYCISHTILIATT